MRHYSEAAVERMMKVQEVIMRALAKKIRSYEGAVSYQSMLQSTASDHNRCGKFHLMSESPA